MVQVRIQSCQQFPTQSPFLQLKQVICNSMSAPMRRGYNTDVVEPWMSALTLILAKLPYLG
jgi:hypothetical protein